MSLLTTLDEHKALADSVPFGNFIALFEAVQQLTPTISGADAQVANAEWTADSIKRGLAPDINKLDQEIKMQDKLLRHAGVPAMEPSLVRTVVLKILAQTHAAWAGHATSNIVHDKTLVDAKLWEHLRSVETTLRVHIDAADAAAKADKKQRDKQNARTEAGRAAAAQHTRGGRGGRTDSTKTSICFAFRDSGKCRFGDR